MKGRAPSRAGWWGRGYPNSSEGVSWRAKDSGSHFSLARLRSTHQPLLP